jgi:carbon monoxide dehydrogenase subunit G
MKLSATYRLPGPPERVFGALTNPDVLCRCIEGCESLVAAGDAAYEARLRIGLGSIKGTYSGLARLADLEPPNSYTLVVEGRGAAGWARGSARMRLSPEGSETILTCDADGQVGGQVAAVGSRLIDAAGRRLADRFFQSLAKELRPER